MQNFTKEAVLVTSGLFFVTILGALWYKKMSQLSVPTKWHLVGKIKTLCIYPLKSGRRVEVHDAACTEFGFKVTATDGSFDYRDRCLIVYKGDSKKNYRSAKMLLIETTAHENAFILNAPEMEALQVENPEAKKITDEIDLAGEKIGTIDCGDEAARWLSKYLLEGEAGLRLGFHDARERRDISEAYKNHIPIYPFLKNEATGLYSNLTSYLVANEASIEDLRERVDCDVSAHNFRPNILVEGAKAYAEDDWKWMKIGDAVLYSAKLCTRCDFTTVNPETAEKSKNHEPLKTLRRYRQLKDLKNIDIDGTKGVMGNNMGLFSGGQITVGDVVYVGK